MSTATRSEIAAEIAARNATNERRRAAHAAELAEIAEHAQLPTADTTIANVLAHALSDDTDGDPCAGILRALHADLDAWGLAMLAIGEDRTGAFERATTSLRPIFDGLARRARVALELHERMLATEQRRAAAGAREQHKAAPPATALDWHDAPACATWIDALEDQIEDLASVAEDATLRPSKRRLGRQEALEILTDARRATGTLIAHGRAGLPADLVPREILTEPST